MTSEPTRTGQDDGDQRQRRAIGPRRRELRRARHGRAATSRAGRRTSASLAAAGGHQQADLVLVGRPAVDDGDQLAAIDDGDPVRQLEDLVELGGDQQDAVPASRLAIAWRWMNSMLPDVEAARRLVEHQQPQVARELAGDDDLLLVAAGQRPGRARRRTASGRRTRAIRSSAVVRIAASLRRMPRGVRRRW